jgi:hypothetical protein
MTSPRLAPPRPRGTTSVAAFLVLALGVVGACDASVAPSSPAASAPSERPTTSPTPAPTPSPTPTPEPTPRFTNEADAELAALIPTEAAGATVVVVPFEEFALTPGDIGSVAFGEIGTRFVSLALAYVEQPRTTLYAMRVEGEEVDTADLEPHLATIGRYVGIAGLDPEPWEEGVVGGTAVWVRPEDNATAAGTHVYTWSAGEYVFLLIGVDDTINRAIVEQLPGQPAPSPSPTPTTRPSRSPSPSADPSASAET